MQVGKVIMLQHQQGFDFFKLTTLEDIKYLAPRLRIEDKQEILAGSGLIPYEALLKGFKNSAIVFTIFNSKNKPVGIFGVDDCGNGVGGIWLLATKDLAKIKIAFLKQCREVIRFLNTKYKILCNFVDCRNQQHIKWLRLCDFKFIRKTNYGVLQKPFYEIIRINNV